MTTWRTSVLAAAGIACLALCSCAKQSTEESRPPAQTNPSDFPLYPGSTLVEVAPIDYGAMFAMIRKNDPSAKLGTNYRGHEIVVSTSATIPQLRTWVTHLRTSPPLGFHFTRTTAGFSIGSGSSSKNAEVDGLFETANAQRVVFVIALDPKRVRAQLGPALDMIDNYTALPPMLRAPIDDQMKHQLGYTVSEMLDRHSPIGIIFATLKTMSTADRRAIVLVDETKTN
ncbi:MAG: hypothetical protein JWN27_2063 [Candidatus Eremiobacteraeota bacterium]|nr:hypothetical protein [Candidatus Eremiobacteraeota bacterium]